MHAIAGHINDNMIVTDENLSSYEGYDVVITVLDTRDNAGNSPFPSESNIKAANRLAGLWENHTDDAPVDDVVREMRKGRSFDY